ncbi:hypothetical protein SARC_10918 [Sphaeroforma arctica JP610]|uniref:Geranylgeranyl transferase type-2 subunit beta n=1 Tax=Sphaeroforma arctica JP610 TaxID=667725 RepID=A0A0L0FIM4_9EUKA|nr:hypothetical protein SARC_10918 [Sphaeroforma arctica JP610]KNC76590.1 hypothetical protein SARC_10918 [Sphaeroforma arctica JP610]|eukprot:XP_014150492.1 hypothetical protein SARC_10918 [Sphaeroforma arctica JP610]
MSASVSSGDSPPTDVTTKRNQMDLHTDAHVKYLAAFGKSQDDYEYHMSEHLRLNGIYWSLTALDMCHKLDESVDVDEVFAFVMACQHPSGGFGAAEGHDAHILFSLSAIQILLIINRIDQLDRRLVGQYLMGLQNEDGSFRGDEWGEVDTRFSFCALAGLSLLGFMHSSDPGAIDKGADTADKGTDAVDSGPVPTDKGTGADHGGVCSRSGSDTQDSRATGAGINIFALDLDKASTGTGNSNDNSTKHALDGLFEGEIDIQTGLVCEYADIDKAARFVLRCKNFDGGFGSLPGSETHAGQIYCCVGALAITKSLHHVDSDLLGWWLAERQTPGGGLNGRPEKLPDVWPAVECNRIWGKHSHAQVTSA